MAKTNDEFLEIDENNLHEEWANQPRMYYRWAKKLADARQEYAEAKAELDVVEAELSRDIRSNPGSYGLDKTTEAVIGHTILVQPRYRDAQASLIEAKHAVDIHDAAVSALDHRKKALEGTVQLFLANYFATPRRPDSENTNGEAFDEGVKRSIRTRGQRKAKG